MEFYRMILCIFIWGIAIFASKAMCAVKSMKMKKVHCRKKLYMLRLLDLAGRGLELEQLQKELYYSFVNERFMRRILYRGLQLEPKKAAALVERKMGCRPMQTIHQYLMERCDYIGNKQSGIPEDVKKRLLSVIDEWEVEYNDRLKASRYRRIKLLVGEFLVFILNVYMYLALSTSLSLWIFVAVNTIGVILMIVVDYEGTLIDQYDTYIGIKGRFNRYKKSQKTASSVQNLYQLVVGLGLIINITTVAVWWLGPVA